MEQVIMYVVTAVIGLADKYPAVSYTLMALSLLSWISMPMGSVN